MHHRIIAELFCAPECIALRLGDFDRVPLEVPPLLATVPQEPRYVLGVVGKQVGMVKHVGIYKARAEAARLANKECATVIVYEIVGSGFGTNVLHETESITPDATPQTRTLADVEPYMCYRDYDGDIVWSYGTGSCIRRLDGRILSHLHVGNVAITGHCLGHVRDVLRMSEPDAAPTCAECGRTLNSQCVCQVCVANHIADAGKMVGSRDDCWSLDRLAAAGLWVVPHATNSGYAMWTVRNARGEMVLTGGYVDDDEAARREATAKAKGKP
jgi:hypothetical protein